jgi:hypothetical protein
LNKAAAGADVADVAMALRLMLMLERVECKIANADAGWHTANPIQRLSH